MQVVINIPKKTFNEIREHNITHCGEPFAQKLVSYIRNGTPIPDNATNGDVIKVMFPNALRSNYTENDMVILYLQDENESEMVVPEDWWFAPYKVESEDK